MLGLCPFHNEKTPSFTVSPAKGIYKCFGCGKAGNAVNFIMEHEQFTYPEALRYLADKYGVEIEESERTDEQKAKDNERESLFLVNQFAAGYFQKTLHEHEAGKAIGLSYFKERGFREDIIEKFSFGYCLDEWTGFTDAALQEGYNIDYLEQTGLTIVKGEKQFDRFKGRVMFPIHNLSGKIIGFGGRTLSSDKNTAKYLNSPESEIYHKSKALYGLYFAKRAVVNEDNCYLVEGYTDVIAMHQAGIENVVAPLGTSLTEEQVTLIKRYAKNLTLLFDGDAAGLKAANRAVEIILSQDIGVKVVIFPEGEDPDSFSKKYSNEEFNDFLTANALNFIQFKVQTAPEEVKKDPLKKAGLIKEVVNSIALVSDHITRSVYVKEAADLLQMEEATLIIELNSVRRKKLSGKLKNLSKEHEHQVPDFKMPVEPQEKEFVQVNREAKEKEMVRLLLLYGERVITVEVENDINPDIQALNMLVAEYILGELEADQIIFVNREYRSIFDEYRHLLGNEILPQQQFFAHHGDETIASLTHDIIMPRYELSDNWANQHHIYTNFEHDKLEATVVNAIYELKLSEVLLRIDRVQKQLREELISPEAMSELLTEQTLLTEAKKALAGRLGRTIL